MLNSKLILSFLILSLTTVAICKPRDYDISQGRGIGSTVWGWVTYPFSWWGSSTEEQPPVNDHLIFSTTHGPFDNIEIGKRNITVWCNDHTCTTMKCDKNGCKNNTCNIYDTDLNGECREYNIVPTTETHVTQNPTEPVSKPITEELTSETVTTGASSTPADIVTDKPVTVERPLQLEAVLSSTVKETNDKDQNNDKINTSSSPINKI